LIEEVKTKHDTPFAKNFEKVLIYHLKGFVKDYVFKAPLNICSRHTYTNHMMLDM
jgi:hypothetical protein